MPHTPCSIGQPPQDLGRNRYVIRATAREEPAELGYWLAVPPALGAPGALVGAGGSGLVPLAPATGAPGAGGAPDACGLASSKTGGATVKGTSNAPLLSELPSRTVKIAL